MKKQLLFGSALLAAISAFSQRSQERPVSLQPSTKNYIDNVASSSVAAPIGPVKPANMGYNSAKGAASSITWNALSGSMNVFGVITTEQKPLQYNDELDIVSFVHRKSPTYVSNPVASPSAAVTGVIVGMVTPNWGADWDSTCMWNNNLHYARYPQGGIYNANSTGQTSMANAYILGSGPITQANSSLGWIGNYFCSKKLDAMHGPGFDNVASTATLAQQFIPNSSPFMIHGVNKVDFLRSDFTATKDGNVWMLGSIMANANGGTLASNLLTGARIIKGTFVSGVFNLSGDSILPNVVVTSANAPNPASTPMVFSPRMAWSESGTVGYVYFLGCRNGATGRNVGIQPIVYRTVDHGQTWNPVAGINFNDTAYYNSRVLNHIPGTAADTTLKIPFFDESFSTSAGIDAVVDGFDNLHIGASLLGCTKKSTDSMFVTVHSFSLSSDNETGYSYAHVPGHRPYLYDFVCPGPTSTATAWSVHVMDSMSTEGPGIRSGDGGFVENPWDINPDGSTKASVNARIQLSRTAGGKYVIFSWAESDTNFTNGAKKWNHIPNVKVNALEVETGLHATEKIDVTNPADGNINTLVASSAFNHYASPKCKLTGTANISPTMRTVDIKIPFTVTNNQNTPLTQLSPNVHYYTSASVSFSFGAAGTSTNPTVTVVAHNTSSLNESFLYPNPTSSNYATLVMGVQNNTNLDIVIMNTVGQVVKSYKAEALAGENNINVDLKGLSSGIYLVNVKSGNASTTKKLVIE